MKVELTRAEVERIILNHINAALPGQHFNTVKGASYRDLPDEVVVLKVKEEENAAQ
jgi:hypothetical protein